MAVFNQSRSFTIQVIFATVFIILLIRLMFLQVFSDKYEKPIIFTGSQLPIGTIRTDGKENFITAVEIAAMQNEFGEALVQEVAIYFEYSLYRGNRTSKVSASEFEAFRSGNYPELARAGVDINFNKSALFRTQLKELFVSNKIDNRVAHIALFPGIQFEFYEALFRVEHVKGLVISTFGSGNGPSDPAMIQLIENYIHQGGLVLNISQCLSGSVQQGKYDASKQFLNAGVIGGGSLTAQAAIRTMMYVLAYYETEAEKSQILKNNLVGEM
jgi:L-asparaginase